MHHHTRYCFTVVIVSVLVKFLLSSQWYTFFRPMFVVCKRKYLTKGCFCGLQGGPAALAMKILYNVILLLLLGGSSCQNKSNTKPSGKSSKKAGSQGGDAAAAHEDDSPAGPAPGDGGRDSSSGGRGTSQQTTTNTKAGDDMKLHFLKNTQVTCNDGTAAGWAGHSRTAWIFYFILAFSSYYLILKYWIYLKY